MHFVLALIFSFCTLTAHSAVEVGKPAPDFKSTTQDGKPFTLSERKDKGWTVLYFYPKAGTPGCTKQACAFRDSVKKIQALNAEVYGISSDTVEAQAKFHKEHKLLFTLLADPELEAIKKFDVKMAVVSMAKRWTFIIDPKLIVRFIDDNVDPVMDAQNVANKLAELQKSGT